MGTEKREATNAYAVLVDRLRVVLSEWDFAQTVEGTVEDEEFQLLKSFGIDTYNTDDLAIEQFARAEDLHALGFVFSALLFTTTSLNLPLYRHQCLRRMMNKSLESIVRMKKLLARENVVDSSSYEGYNATIKWYMSIVFGVVLNLIHFKVAQSPPR